MGIGVVLRCSAIANLVEVNRELGSVERAVFAQIFARRDDLIPRLQLRHIRLLSPLSPYGRGVGGEGFHSPLAPWGRGVGGEGLGLTVFRTCRDSSSAS